LPIASTSAKKTCVELLLGDNYFCARRPDVVVAEHKPEIEHYLALTGDRQTRWLFGRMAAKDALRSWLWQRGAGPIFPIEVEIAVESSGQPRVRTQYAADLQLSIAHKDELAYAYVTQGRPAGVDVERIEPRGAGFEEIAFTESERALLPAAQRDAWITRFWVAKEAAAKARGTGLGGNPKRWVVRRVVGEHLLVDDIWVATRRDGERIVGWTAEDPEGPRDQ